MIAVLIGDPKDVSANADRSHGPEVGSCDPIVVVEVGDNSPAQPATHSALRWSATAHCEIFWGSKQG